MKIQTLLALLGTTAAATSLAACDVPPEPDLPRVDASAVEQSRAALFTGTRATNTLLWWSPPAGQIALTALSGTNYFASGDIVAPGADWLGLWQIVGTGDFDGDGHGDLLWRHRVTSDVTVWLMVGQGVKATPPALGKAPSKDARADVADLNGDGISDVLWSGKRTVVKPRPDGQIGVGPGATPDSPIPTDPNLREVLWREGWLLDFTKPAPLIGTTHGTGNVLGVGRFDQSPGADIVTRGADDVIKVQFDAGGVLTVGKMPAAWKVATVGDFNGDGWSDILLRHETLGSTTAYLTKEGRFEGAFAPPTVPTSWQVLGVGDIDGNGVSDLVWRDNAGDHSVWTFDRGNKILHRGSRLPVPPDFVFIGVLPTATRFGSYMAEFQMDPYESDPQYVRCGTEDVVITSSSHGVPFETRAKVYGGITGRGNNMVCNQKLASSIALLPGMYLMRNDELGWSYWFDVRANEASGSQITWYQPAPASLSSKQLECGGTFEVVDALGAWVNIPRSVLYGLIPIGGNVLTYHCNNGPAKTYQCPAESSHIYVDRFHSSDPLITCYTFKEMSLGTRTGQCDGDLMAVWRSKYALVDDTLTYIPRGGSDSVPLHEETFSYRCLSEPKFEELRVEGGLSCTEAGNGRTVQCRPTGVVSEGVLRKIKDLFFPSGTPSIECQRGTNSVRIERNATGNTFNALCSYHPRRGPVQN